MEKLPGVHHSEGIHLDVFPKLHEFSRGYFSFAKANLTNQAAPAILPLPQGCSSIFKVQRQEKYPAECAPGVGSASGSQQKTLVWEVVVFANQFFFTKVVHNGN